MSRFDDKPSLLAMAFDLYHVVGYNHYRDENLMRADDQKVRALVSDVLCRARKSVTDAESAFRQERMPPPSRANPFPPADAVAQAKRLEALASRIGSIEGQVRHAPVPEGDRMTRRYREEGQTLDQLIERDSLLVGQAEALRKLVDGKDADGIVAIAGEVEEGVRAIVDSLGARQVMVM